MQHSSVFGAGASLCGSQVEEVKVRHERDHKAATHSLKKQLQRLQTELSSQAASALTSKAALVSSADHQMLQHGSGMAVADACRLNQTRECAEQVNVKDGWRHHDRRLLGCCFRGDCSCAMKLCVRCVDDLLLRGLPSSSLSPLLAFSYQQPPASHCHI